MAEILKDATAKPAHGADRELAGQVVHNLLHLIATVSPGAKLGSTAPYGYADLMLVEAGRRQPRSLANAFRSPARAQTGDAVSKLTAHLQSLDEAYGARETRRVMSLGECDIPQAARIPLDDLASWTAGMVREGEPAPATESAPQSGGRRAGRSRRGG